MTRTGRRHRRPVAVGAAVAAGALLAMTGCGSGGETTTDAPAPDSGPAATAGPPAAGGGLPPLPESFEVSARPATPAGSQSRTARPTRVRLPSGAVVPVRTASTTAAGRLAVPDDVELAGWWDGGARLGERYGAMLIASHVDSRTQGVGPFAELLEVSTGDPVEVTAARLAKTFRVADVEVLPRDELPSRDDLFSAAGPSRLVLVTCAPPFVAAAGGYQNLVVVTATPPGAARRS